MKNKIVFPLFLFISLTIACNSQNSNSINLKNLLIENLVNNLEAQSTKVNNKIVILKTKYCEEFDCEVYFQDYKKHIQIYTREDAFMRNLKTYLEIEDLDEKNGQIILQKRIGSEFKELRIRL